MTIEKTLLLVGATSDIGHAVALRYAGAGWRVVLCARDTEAAARNRDDLAARTGAAVTLLRLDIRETDTFAALLDGLPTLPDTVVCAVGELGEPARTQADPDAAARVYAVNFTGPALLLGMLAERFAARGGGTLVGISSVAGERGRGSNTAYGAAKAGFTAYLSGLRNRLARSGVRVVTVKPGFVRTRMTRGMRLPPALTADPEAVGAAVYRAAEIRPADVVWVRPVWRLVMAVIRAIPEPVFKRLTL